MSNWNEADHPRDDEGKFTFKGGSSSFSSSIRETNEEKMQRRADTLNPTMQDNKTNNNQIDYANIGLGNNIGGTFTGGAVVETTKEPVDNSIFSDDTWIKTRKFITREEVFSEKAYKPIKTDVWTIGYGHTEGVKEGDTITREQAEELFKNDFKKYSSCLKNVTVPLNDNEKVALISFVYNVGPGAFKNSTLLKKLNKGDKKGAADEFDRWIYQKGKKLDGLVNRRKREKDLFLTSVED
jgi:lysozyme